MSKDSNVVAFPRQLRMVPMAPSAVPDTVVLAGPLVDHDGALYPLEDLLRRLTPEELHQVAAAAPRSVQETWDEVVRSWPALAAEIVAGVPKVR